MSVAAPARLSAGLEPVLARLRAAQEGDGLWRTPYLGSTGHTAIGLLATVGLGPADEDVTCATQLALGIAGGQQPDGAWPAYGMGPDSPATTRLAASAIAAVLAQWDRQLSPQAREVLSGSVTRARKFLVHAPRERDPFWSLLADSAVGATGIDAAVEDLLRPFAALGAWAFLSARAFRGLRGDVSAFTAEALPGMALLVVCPRSAASSRLGRWARAAVRAVEASALERLARRVESVQNPNGSWLWSVFGTAINLFALSQMGRDPASEPIRRGLAFIRSLRAASSEGGWRQRWCNAELWDTSVAGMILLGLGVEPEAWKGPAIAERFIAEQRPQALWAFGAGSRRGDHDSTAIAVSFLVRLAGRLSGALATRALDAARAAAQSLLFAQQPDGGWGYSPAPSRAPYGFRRRVPFGLETAAIDASTADVTGRVLACLSAAEGVGALAGHEARLSEARRRAVAFFEQAQAPCGSWFGRWSPGYLLSANYAGPVLRTLGARGLLARLRTFLTAHQNADGGFGETPEADLDPARAGVGPSTPVHTAYAVVGLVATAAADDVRQDAVLSQACLYLSRAAGGPSLDAGRPLYTVAFREDYYDAPRMTDAAVLVALQYAARAGELGADAATRELVTGSAAPAPVKPP